MPSLQLRLTRLLAVLSLIVTAAPATADMFPHSSRQNLLFSEIETLTCDALWHAKSEIYARNGFRFSTERGIKVFGRGGRTKTPRLSALEKYNVSQIRQRERDKGC